ncbi:hypothetical protein [uncultured Helicobacter sp.]|uniref:hypothetical protein n=1 Tax=uncultured Helicobacter sp. TaxID=175537 RepID=UPI002591E0C9|nr:hypothetical protein [uncultured Helicobacter sp.]
MFDKVVEGIVAKNNNVLFYLVLECGNASKSSQNLSLLSQAIILQTFYRSYKNHKISPYRLFYIYF